MRMYNTFHPEKIHEFIIIFLSRMYICIYIGKRNRAWSSEKSENLEHRNGVMTLSDPFPFSAFFVH